MAYSLFRFIGAAGRTLTVASTFGAFALMIIFVLGGFVVSRGAIDCHYPLILITINCTSLSQSFQFFFFELDFYQCLDLDLITTMLVFAGR